MSTEEIINILETLQKEEHAKNAMLPDGEPLVNEWLKAERALGEAIGLLKAHQDAQPNEPLTLEELRETDGVVWICYPQATFGNRQPPAGQLTCTRYKFDFSDYGKNWLAYRRPPKEGF